MVEVVVQGIYTVCLCICCFAHQTSTPHNHFPQRLADVCTIREILGNNVVGTGKGILHCADTGFFIDIVLCQQFRGLTVLSKNRLSQGGKSLFTGNRSSGSPLLLIGAV